MCERLKPGGQPPAHVTGRIYLAVFLKELISRPQEGETEEDDGGVILRFCHNGSFPALANATSLVTLSLRGWGRKVKPLTDALWKTREDVGTRRV